MDAEVLRRNRQRPPVRAEARPFDLRPALLAAGAAALVGTVLALATPARSEPASPAGPRIVLAASNPDDIVVTARRKLEPSLKEVQEFNAAELARMRPLYEPPPPYVRSYETDVVSYRTPLGQKMAALTEGAPRLRDTVQAIEDAR